ncbi:MAG: hypothetical protein L0Z49_00775 [Actinobacteria bacterium]|nr:hypothetical protein [Actinomycetota bacterium]
MPSRYRALVITGVYSLVLVPAMAASAAETTNSEIVLVRENDVVTEDLYAAAVAIRVVGAIDGDLMAVAAEQVVIEGTVTGSVTVVAPRVVVSGDVGGSLRVVAREVSVTGSIGRDIVATAYRLELGSGSRVDSDVLAWVYGMKALGAIGGDLTGSQRGLDLAGSVAGDVDVNVARLHIVDDLTVTGDLGYRSDGVAEGLESAEVAGAVVKKDILPPNIRVRALGLFARILAVVFVAIAAVTTVWAWPRATRSAAMTVRSRPWRSWLYGAAIVFSPLLVVLGAIAILSFAPPAAALPLLALVIPLTMALIGLVLVLSLVAGVPVAAWVGERLNRRWGPLGAVIAGSAVLGLGWCLPLIGWLVPLVALPLGLGAWLLSRSPQSSETVA